MEGAPSITSSLPGEIEGSCGENLQLRCTADGQPNPEVNDFLDALAPLKTMFKINSVTDVFKITRFQE